MRELIYNQHSIPKGQWRYGCRSSAATGCGWIATYNALCLLGRGVKPERLIRYYQRQLPLIHGNVGTSIWGPALCFRQLGYRVHMVVGRKRLDRAVQQSDVSILFYYWRRGWRIGAHFVALHHTKDGYVGYNTFKNSTGPDDYGKSLETFLKRNHFFGAVLTTISKQ